MRALSDIAGEIRHDWAKINYAARPYVDAMATMERVEDNYLFDSGRRIVGGFLANAGSWRGEVARRVKAELREMLG